MSTRTPAPARRTASRAAPTPVRSDESEVTPPKPMTVRAYEDIKSRILSMELRPGQFLNEATLCEMVGLGRMPVHQAIHRLQAERLIEVIPRKGLLVRSDTLNDVIEMLEARMAIEPNVAALAAERIPKERLAALRALLHDSQQLIARNERAAFRVVDRAFHGVIGDGAGNRILAETMRPLHERSDLIWHLRIMPHETLEITQNEHQAILKAIVRRDAQAAREAMQAHLMSLHKRVLAASLHAPAQLSAHPLPSPAPGRTSPK